MAQEIFKRYEKKYMLSNEQYQKLMCELAKHMYADEYGLHTISNIYFDTPDYALIRQSIEKPKYKEKVRMRGYGDITGDSTVFLEIKKKYDGVVYKRRASMTLDEARAYLKEGTAPSGNPQILKEIDYDFKRYQLEPKVFLAYDRMAFADKENSDLRVTFDRRIRCRSRHLDLEEKGPEILLLPEDQVLMEVKIPGAMPLWMCRLFSECEIYPTSFSKYGTFYQRYLYQEAEKAARYAGVPANVKEGVFAYA